MSRIGLLLVAVVMGFAMAPQAAQAAWLRAESDRFVVYGEGGERKVRDFLVKLTTFDNLLRTLYPTPNAQAPSTKLQVILVRNSYDLRRIAPKMRSSIVGFYGAETQGVFAVVVTDKEFGADDVLFHEYAHHFMRENFPYAYPSWFVEGFAEYFMTAEVTPQGVKVGGYNESRAYSVMAASWLPWNDVLTKRPSEIRRDEIGTYYAQAWLLTHYLLSSSERASQLAKALTATGSGENAANSFWASTKWTSATLTRDLRDYTRLRVRIFTDILKAQPQIVIQAMPASADALFLDQMRMLVSGEADLELLEGVRRRAGRYPGDEFAEKTLARAEYMAGDVAIADALVERWLAVRPDDYETLLLGGVGKIAAGERDKLRTKEHFRAARPLLGKAFTQNKSDFRVLGAYARSRSVEKAFPTENDLNVMSEAWALAPSVSENAMMAGLALLALNRKAEADKVLSPIANDPHGGRASIFAKALIDGKTKVDAEAAAKAIEGADEPPGPPPA